jgi:hypothetical protein
MPTLDGKHILFAVSNRHSANQCVPPDVFDPPQESGNVGYFENEDGKQLVYVFDTATGRAQVRMGERSWDEIFKLVPDEGGYCHLESLDGDHVPLRPSEHLWLRACWSVSLLVRRKTASQSPSPSSIVPAHVGST